MAVPAWWLCAEALLCLPSFQEDVVVLSWGLFRCARTRVLSLIPERGSRLGSRVDSVLLPVRGGLSSGSAASVEQAAVDCALAPRPLPPPRLFPEFRAPSGPSSRSGDIHAGVRVSHSGPGAALTLISATRCPHVDAFLPRCLLAQPAWREDLAVSCSVPVSYLSCLRKLATPPFVRTAPLLHASYRLFLLHLQLDGGSWGGGVECGGCGPQEGSRLCFEGLGGD